MSGLRFPLPTALRIAAVLLVGAGTTGFFVLGEFLAGPFVVAAVLLALSFAGEAWSRGVARAVLVISLLIPVGALLGHLRGDLLVAVPIFDALVFSWLFWNALPAATGLATGKATTA